MSIVLSQLRWPSLAHDLAAMTVPGSPLTELPIIYQKYGITDQELKAIIGIPNFQKMFEQELANFRAQGDKAAPAYRANVLSQALTEKLFTDATSVDGKMEAKDAIKLLELLLRTSGLINQKGESTVNVQANVGISIPNPAGLTKPKLQHLVQHPQPIDTGVANGS